MDKSRASWVGGREGVLVIVFGCEMQSEEGSVGEGFGGAGEGGCFCWNRKWDSLKMTCLKIKTLPVDCCRH